MKDTFTFLVARYGPSCFSSEESLNAAKQFIMESQLGAAEVMRQYQHEEGFYDGYLDDILSSMLYVKNLFVVHKRLIQMVYVMNTKGQNEGFTCK